jgi:hypothetical protein
MIRLTISLFCLLALSACKTTDERNYDSYLAAVNAERQQRAMQLDSIADASACGGDATCVVAAKGFAALAVAGSQQGTNIRPYQRQASAAERVTIAALSALPGLGQVWAAVEAGKRNVDIARINADSEIAQQDAWAATVAAVSSAYGSLPPSTAITVGGDYIPGSQHVGDAIGGDVVTVGRDQIGGDQQVGDNATAGRDMIGGDSRQGDDIGGDAIGGDRIDGSNIGDGNRIDSPGPFETDNSSNCEGERCQGDGDVNPEPDPDEGG